MFVFYGVIRLIFGSATTLIEARRYNYPQFAFYAPMGYDIGNVIANMLFAWETFNVSLDGKLRKR